MLIKVLEQIKMKFTSIIAIFVSTMAVTAVPMADPDPDLDLDLDLAIANPLETRDLSAAECRTACAEGAEAVERFCRRIPSKKIRFFCWGAAAAAESTVGQDICIAFCDSWF